MCRWPFVDCNTLLHTYEFRFLLLTCQMPNYDDRVVNSKNKINGIANWDKTPSCDGIEPPAKGKSIYIVDE